MTDTWNEAIGNYNYYPNNRQSTNIWRPITFLGGYSRGEKPDEVHQKELALAVCAEQDDCWGVRGMAPWDTQNSGWTYNLFGSAMVKTSDGGPEPGVSRYNEGRGRRMWIKKAGTTKPSQHKPGPGILPANGDTKVKICTDATGQSGCAPVGRGFWPRSMPNAGGANSVVVPIGY